MRKIVFFALLLASPLCYADLLIGPEGGRTLGHTDVFIFDSYSYWGITVGGLVGLDWKLFNLNNVILLNVNTFFNYRYQNLTSCTAAGYGGTLFSGSGKYDYDALITICYTSQKIGLDIEPVIIWRMTDGLDIQVGGAFLPSWRFITTYSLNPDVSSNRIETSPLAFSIAPFVGLKFKFGPDSGFMIRGGYEFELLSLSQDYALYMNNIWFSILLDYKLGN